ncbi:putative phage capsid protein (Mu-like phage) [Magnetospirillum sp. XM-1]|uniref:DUF3164 family protein n=1 Tax=Magnetospirillum sp. XM-1 TaxID=1663591 RepID=UPI00073DFACB|nr:DUF3164 family protein [Magnetospirillum sp. XM-1]CUW41108.1 putative phage capsid protein (Mu-like phage) [Magnetospirillum sp. XM-1]
MTVQQTINHPGAVIVDGIARLPDDKGNLVALANIKPMDLLMDEMVRKVVAYGEDLSAELARFAAHTDADIAALDALIAQDYGVEPKETKGNRTFTSFDGLLQVKVAVSERIVLGPELQAAKTVLDSLIRERGTGVDPFLMTLIQRAFKVDQEGKVDVRSILALRRMQVDDPRWPDFCRAIDDSVRVVGSKRYIRIYRRPNPQANWSMVPLDLAAVEPTPAAFERRSLRRQVEETEQLNTRLADLLDRALMHLSLEGGNTEVARDLIASSLRLLGIPERIQAGSQGEG